MKLSQNRDQTLLDLRPAIPTLSETATSTAEQFQNKTLRPILKLQNDLFVAVFNKYIVQRKNVFPTLTKTKKRAYIEHAIKKDWRFKNRLLGIVIGQFTMEEYQTFTEDEAELTRRFATMLVKRLQDQLVE